MRAAVAQQHGRAPDRYSGGRGFKSRQRHHIYKGISDRYSDPFFFLLFSKGCIIPRLVNIKIKIKMYEKNFY